MCCCPPDLLEVNDVQGAYGTVHQLSERAIAPLGEARVTFAFCLGELVAAEWDLMRRASTTVRGADRQALRTERILGCGITRDRLEREGMCRLHLPAMRRVRCCRS